MKVGFIGAGKVGFSLGKYFLVNGIQVTGYYSRHTESAKAAAEFTDTKGYDEISELVKDSDVIFLTVPDGEIQTVYVQLLQYDIKNKQICHCSGSISAKEAFADIEQYEACGYSIHPLFPVSDKLNSYRELSDAFFCLEGDREYLAWWEEFFSCHSKGVKLIEGSDKVKYHAACAIASNLYCALMQESLELLAECGFSQNEALTALTPLVESNVSHILKDGPIAALTGPVERADAVTIAKHLKCFDRSYDYEMYLAVTRKLMELAKEKNPDRDYSILNESIWRK